MARIDFRCALLAAMALAVPGAAHASTILVAAPAFDSFGSRWGNVIYAPGNLSMNMRMGRNLLAGIDPQTGRPLSFLSYALDIMTPLQGGGFELQALARIVDDPVKLNQISALVAHADPLANSPNKAAAIQMAIWEIIYEQGTSGYNVATGQFRVRGGDSGTARTLANHYLSNVEKLVWLPDRTQRFASLTAVSNQAQLIRAAVVPEPQTWAMMIAGFIGVGAALRRGRRATLADQGGARRRLR